MSKLKTRLTPVAAILQANIGDAFNMDALVSLYKVVENLDNITPELQKQLDYAVHIPVDNVTGVLGGGEALLQKVGIGKGKEHTGTGKDIPLADTIYSQVTLPIKLGVIGYRYSVEEIKTALAAGIDLDADKVDSARLAAERHLSDVAWFGYYKANEAGEVFKADGFVNQTKVTKIIALSDWATAAIGAVLADVNNAITDAATAFDVESGIEPDTFLLASQQYVNLSTRVVPDAGGKTFLQYIKENNIFTTQGKTINFVGTGRTNGKGVAGVDRSIIYRKDPKCIVMKCDDVDFLAAQPDGLDILVPGSYKYQGVWVKRLDSMRYLDHVN